MGGGCSWCVCVMGANVQGYEARSLMHAMARGKRNNVVMASEQLHEDVGPLPIPTQRETYQAFVAMNSEELA
jgi:hypothetical protein